MEQEFFVVGMPVVKIKIMPIDMKVSQYIV